MEVRLAFLRKFPAGMHVIRHLCDYASQFRIPWDCDRISAVGSGSDLEGGLNRDESIWLLSHGGALPLTAYARQQSTPPRPSSWKCS